MNKEELIKEILTIMENIEDEQRTIGFSEWWELKKQIKKLGEENERNTKNNKI